MDLSQQLYETLPTREEQAKAMRARCAIVAAAIAGRAPERLTPHTLAALAAGEMTAGAGYSSPLRNARGRA